jgi:hypothetical protein
VAVDSRSGIGKEGSPVPRLTIVIPCLGGAAEFDGTLVSVLQHRPADCEVLVLHVDQYDDPYGLEGEVRFLQVAGRPTLVDLVNRGLAAAAGDIIHVVACDLQPAEGWTEPALKQFQLDRDVAAVAPVILAADRQQIAAAGVCWSAAGQRRVLSGPRALEQAARAACLGPALAAGFFRRDVLEAWHGFESSLGDDLADVGLAIAIRDLGL